MRALWPQPVEREDLPGAGGLPDKDEVYTFDLGQNLSEPVETQIIPGITNVVWNDATQSCLVSIVQGDGTEIRTLDGEVIAKVPEYQMPRLNFALSSLGTYLAVGSGAIMMSSSGQRPLAHFQVQFVYRSAVSKNREN